MKEQKPEPNGRSAPVRRRPPIHIATPEALARALLRPLTPPDPALRKGRVSGESA